MFCVLLVVVLLSSSEAFLFPNANPVELQRQTFMGVLAKKLGILDFYANLFRGIHTTFIRPFEVRYDSYER